MTNTILICDDDESLRVLVRATLEDTGCAIVEARDGNQALELARSVKPDLVVLDMMMPGRTGLEVLVELRADPELADTAVVMLTASAQRADEIAAREAGVDRFLPKPFSPAELAETVDELLGARAC